MAKGYRTIMAFFILCAGFIPVSAQDADYNPLYGPPPKYQPLPVVKRLSYENFRNMKLLQAAIQNYGGGDSETDRLIDGYSEASALYFENRINEASAAFIRNETAIFESARNLSGIYRRNTEQLVSGALKIGIKKSMRDAVEGRRYEPLSDKFITNAQYALQQANDYYDRFAKAKSANPRELITAIYYYRRAQESIFQMYEYRYLGDASRMKDKDKVKALHRKVDEDKTLTEEEKRLIKEQYTLRALEDIRNRPYRSMEKEN